MSQERAGLGLDDDSIDLEELTGTSQPRKMTPAVKKDLETEGAKLGFVSREPTKKPKKKRSPYVLQKNIKMRIGMPELLGELTAKIKAESDQETLEQAIKALIEARGLDGLQAKFEKLCKDS